LERARSFDSIADGAFYRLILPQIFCGVIMSDLSIVNLSGYRFVSLNYDRLLTLRVSLKAKADECHLKGTILLSSEGINAFLAGARENIDAFVAFINTYSEFEGIWFKESFTHYQPFNRMLVRLKKEIIPMGKDQITPSIKTAPYVTPEELRQWYQENRDMVILDTRNDYEIAMGTFENAYDMHLKHFREFDEAVDYLPQDMKEKTVVTFCTGGIRCEKAAELMAQKGFKNVYQLHGGILNYFEKCGGDFYRGDCFVFDQRIAVNSALQETDAKQCFDCRAALQAEEVVQGKCPHCGSKSISKMAA
jgi:UPF0176 protein